MKVHSMEAILIQILALIFLCCFSLALSVPKSSMIDQEKKKKLLPFGLFYRNESHALKWAIILLIEMHASQVEESLMANNLD